MEPDDREVGGGRQHRGDRVRIALGHVHADVGQRVVAEEPEGLPLVVLRHPGVVAELDADRDRSAPALAFEQVLLVPTSDWEPLRELEEQPAQLPRVEQRCQGRQEPFPHRLHESGVGVPLVEVPRPLGSQVLRQGRGFRRVVGQQGERLDREGEVGGSALRPEPGGVLGRRGVVGRVDLHQGEPRGVVAEPVLGGPGLGRVPVGGQQGGIGPPRRTHQDLAHAPNGSPGLRGRQPSAR